MHIKSIPFSHLPFPKLFQDYIQQKPEITNFFETSPFSESAIRKRIDSTAFNGNRAAIIKILNQINSDFKAPDQTFNSIQKLENEEALAVVTGQQLTVLGGPLFTVYKVLSAIAVAKKWEKKYKRPFVPVFWLADEDHDFEEAARLAVLLGDDLKEFSLDNKLFNGERVGEIELDPGFTQFVEDVKSTQPETDFSEQLWDSLAECYDNGSTLREAFAKWLLTLFGEHGLVLAGSNFKPVKEFLRDPLSSSVTHYDEHYSALEKTSGELIKAGYHNQVHLQYSNLFWIDPEGKRLKIRKTDNGWQSDDEKRAWSDSRLVDEILESPGAFSPNVFLRPIVQDHLLPTIAYIAGPGEIAYYSQMKELYREFGMKMPVIVPRFSSTIVESGIERIFGKLPFSLGDYSHRIEDLEKSYVESSNSRDIDGIFENWKHLVDNISEEMIGKITQFDTTLEGTVGKARSVYFGELDKLKGKVYRSVKQQEKTQINRIHKIKNNLFPNGNLQEREVAFICYMNKYGPGIWDELLDLLENETPDSHKLVYLS